MTTGAYVYAILVDGIVRYVGKGNGNRTREHLRIVARLVAGQPGGPKEQVVHRRLAKAQMSGCSILIDKVAVGLTDAEAYNVEREVISAAPKGQLWNLHEGGIGTTSDFARAKWADPEYRANQAKAMRDPVVIERRRAAQREAQNRPDVRARVKAAQRKAFSRPEFRAQLSASRVRMWQNGEYRAKVVAGRKAQWTPEARAKQSTTLKKCWTPERRKKKGADVRAHWADPIASQKHRDGMKASWTPERRAQKAETMRALNATRRKAVA